MSASTAVLGAGACLAAFGALFYMQSHGVAGPQESFMYRNPEWTGYGVVMAAAGAVAAAAGIAMRLKSRRRRDPGA